MSGETRIAGAVVAAFTLLPLIVEMPGGPLTLRSAGYGLGWLGAGMLSSCLLLTVREPIIVRWCGGQERMRRWHHALGIAACAALLAHPISLALAVLPNAARAWSLLSPGRWFPANALGWVALLGLAVGLIAPLLWHFPHATWRRIHCSLSIAVLLGVGHAFAYRGLQAGVVLAVVPAVFALGWRMLRAERTLQRSAEPRS